MSKVIGIMGKSGSGKTSSLRNLDPASTFIIDCDRKGLNWKGWKQQYNGSKENGPINYWKCNNPSIALSILKKINEQPNFQNIKVVVIDTLNGLMVAEEQNILKMTSGDKRGAWSDMAVYIWDILEYALDVREDLYVVLIAHCETVSDDNGYVETRIKTNGRKLEKMVLESKMDVVLWAVKDGGYKFVVKADNCTAKTPLGMFPDDVTEIPNDIKPVIDALAEY